VENRPDRRDEETELSFHSPRGEGRASAGCLFTVSLLFLGLMGIALLTSAVFGREGGLKDLAGLGSFMGIPGLILIFQAIWQRTRPGLVVPHEDVAVEPWTRFPGDRTGARDETGERALAYLRRSLALLLFLAPAGLVAWLLDDVVPISIALLLGLSIVTVVVFSRSITLFARFRRFGGARFRFDRFPFFLGETLEGRLVVAVPLPPLERLRLQLRCVKETHVPGEKSSSDVAMRVWSAERRPRAEDVSADRRERRVRFELPKSAPPTRFSSPYPEYWELLVTADLPGPDYGAVFLVPVYARSTP
jgi:hypothetical protein